MNRFLVKIKNAIQKKTYRKSIKKIGFFFLGLITLLLLSSIGLALYIKQNQSAILSEINNQINENINGKIEIGDVNFKFFKGFPKATLALNDVELKDSLWSIHKRTFFKANEIEVRLNVWDLINNKINIHKIVVNNAAFTLYKDQKGYTNAYLLQPKKQLINANQKAFINEFVLNQVHFIALNEKDKKLFDFEIASLKSKLFYNDAHIKTNISFKTLVKNMVFKPKNGSFLKEKWVEGLFAVDFSSTQNIINFTAKKLKLGNDPFELKGFVNLGKYNSDFKLDLKTKILWSNMTPLLSPNISKTLNKFNLKNPANGSCIISGQWDIVGNPKIIIKAKIIDNEFKTPDGVITNCAFIGEYNNHYVKGKGNNDPNSVIILKNFKGNYLKIPFEMPIIKIIDLKKPVASGKFKSEFEIKKLNEFINKKLIGFYSGQTTINLDFKINILDLKISKPIFTGNVLVKNAHLEYMPKNLVFKNTDVELAFTDQSLKIKKIKYKDQENAIYMEGRIDNFMHLYYYDSDKMVVNWNIYSPVLNAKQFLGVLAKKTKGSSIQKKKDFLFSEKLQRIFDNSKAIINLKVDKLLYEKEISEKLSASIIMDNNNLQVKNGKLNTLGGTIDFEGELIPKNNYIAFTSQTKLTNLDLKQVLISINNFGLKSLKSQNINGQISLNANISGMLLPKGQLVQNSIAVEVKKGIINSLGGNITFDGELLPKNKMFYFNFNTQINQINAAEFLTTFDNFGMKSLNTTYLNGPFSANTSVSGQLLPNWKTNGNTIHLNINEGILKSFEGNINFEGQLIPKNKSYAFTTTAHISQVNLDQLLSTFSYFDIKTLEKQKIKGTFSTTATINGMILSNGNLIDNSNEIDLKKGLIKSLGGTIAFDGRLFPKNNLYNFSANAKINNVAVSQFLETFDNFGITSFKPKNISGQLNSVANINGIINPNNGFVPNSIAGDVKINIKDGSLEDFEPLKKVWKFIFPFRDLKNITFSTISGDLKLNGDIVNVNSFKVNSNVLNFDMEGIYSFNKGTNLALTVPLRNPKKDELISDEIRKIEKRDNGIVLHLLAVDGPDGKIKIKWNKKKEKKKKSN